jgi:hypothetical protein
MVSSLQVICQLTSFLSNLHALVDSDSDIRHLGVVDSQRCIAVLIVVIFYEILYVLLQNADIVQNTGGQDELVDLVHIVLYDSCLESTKSALQHPERTFHRHPSL